MKKAASRIYLGLIFLFLYLPIIVLIVFSFNDSKSRVIFTEFTFKWYVELFRDDIVMKSLWNTIVIAAAASIGATILGTAAAVGIHAMNKKIRGIIVNITYLPIINPEIVTGVSLMLLFSMIGYIFGFELPFGYGTLIAAHITFCVPYVVLNVLPKLRQMDVALYEAAMDLGCSPTQAFFKAVIPEIMPGIMTGFLMSITYSIDDFVVSHFVSSASVQTLPIVIESMTRKQVSPKINALSAIIFVVVLVLLLAANIKDIKNHEKTQKKSRARV